MRRGPHTSSDPGGPGAWGRTGGASKIAPTFFGDAAADPSLLASYPGLLSTTTGTLYPQTGAASVAATGGSTDPVYEYRGASADPYGGGAWAIPSSTSLAASLNDFATGSGWTKTGTMTVTASGITSPDGVTNARLLYQTTANYAELATAITSTTLPISYSCWYIDGSPAPARPTWPAFTHQSFAPGGAGAVFPASASWARAAFALAGGTSSTVGITPAGSNTAGTAPSNAGPAAAIVAALYTATLGAHDLPAYTGTVSAAKTLDAAHSALLVDSRGNLDFQITFQISASAWSVETSPTYLWSYTTSEGLTALRVIIVGGVCYFVLMVRGVDVLSTQTAGSTQYHLSQPREPYTVRAWYNVSSGVCGMRLSVNGCYPPDVPGTTTGGALVAPTTVYLGSNLGSSTAAFVGRFKPYVRPVPLATAPAAAQVEGLIVGDSILSSFYASVVLDSVGSLIYKTGAQGEWVTRPGIGCLARPGYLVADEIAWFNNALNQWKGLASVKWIVVQVGIGDVLTGVAAATIIASLQTLISDLRAAHPTAKIIHNTMIPARSYSTMTTPEYVVWQTVNAAIMAGTITGSDLQINTASTSCPLNDGSDNLAAIYNIGDGLHTNEAGRVFQALDATYGFRPPLVAWGLLPA